MDPKRVESVFLAAVETGALAAREAILELECADGPDLRRRVMALLAAHDTPDRLLDGTSAADLPSRPPRTMFPGSTSAQ